MDANTNTTTNNTKYNRQQNKQRKAGMSYYWQINFSSIQGKLTIGFLALSSVALAIMLVTNLQWKLAVGKNGKLMENIPWAHQSLGRVVDGVSESVALMHVSFISDDKTYRTKSLDLWRDQIKPAADSLANLSAEWDDDKLVTQQEDLQRSLSIWLNILTTQTSDETVHAKQLASQLDLITEQAQRVRQQLITYQQGEYSSLNRQEENIPLSMVVIFMVAFIVSFIVGVYIVQNVLARIRFLKYELRKLSAGDLPDPIPSTNDETNSLILEINTLTDNLKQIRVFAEEVGKGNFESDIKVFDNQGDLGSSLAQMRESLQSVAKADQIRIWANEGYALFAEILRHHSSDLHALSDELISNVVNYMKVVQGSLFIVNENEEGQKYLELFSCYAYDKKKFVQKTINIGEGLVGQVYLEGEVAYMTKVPQNYVHITSGLGEATPRSIVIVPLKINSEVNGVIELASFKSFERHEIDFLKRIAESIASTVTAVKSAEHTQKLLKESQQMTLQMRLQEEAMRQQMEELQATQEEMERSRYND